MSEKTFKNCVYFIPHYRKDETRYHVILGCGHCRNRLPNGRPRNTDQICGCFLEKDLQSEKQARIKSAAECLDTIADRIAELKEVLKD